MTTHRQIDIDHGRENLRTVFASAREQAVTEGRDWYPTAHRYARDMSSDSLSLDSAAGIIAALSPQRSTAVLGGRKVRSFHRETIGP